MAENNKYEGNFPACSGCLFAVQEFEKFCYSLIHMKNSEKRSDFVHIRSILDDVLKPYQASPEFALKEVWNLWDEAVGKTIAQNARPAAFKGKLLVVHVSSSTWIHQLQFLKNDMITKLNAVSGKPLIEEIKFKIGPLGD
jgi:predicted nucleic acid-binding Zn ribbon protein